MRLLVGAHSGTARQDGDVRFPGDVAGNDLVAKLLKDLDARADEDQPGFQTGTGEVGVLGEEAVTRMDGIDLVLLGQGDDAGYVEVGADRLAGLADAIRLVGLEAVQGEAIFMRVDGHRADAEFGRGAENASGDLAAVGNEQLFDRARRWLSFLRHDGSSPLLLVRHSFGHAYTRE